MKRAILAGFLLISLIMLSAATTTAQDFSALLSAVEKIELNLKRLVEAESEARSQELAQLKLQMKSMSSQQAFPDNSAQLAQLAEAVKNLNQQFEAFKVTWSDNSTQGPLLDDLQKEIEWMKLELQSFKTFAEVNSPKLASLGGLPPSGARASGSNQAAKPGPKYHNLRYQDNYSYLSNAANRGNDLFDPLKMISLGGKSHLSIGGSYRFRYESDNNRKLGAADPAAQEYYLNRVFLFADLQLIGRLRLFTEFKYAGIRNNQTPVGAITHDRPDIENLFIDGWFVKNDAFKFGLRTGRQELQYGKQRLISPLNWANTRRTFDGVKLMSNFSGWSIDAFATRPVKVDPLKLNAADNDLMFSGLYASKKLHGNTLSGYLLSYNQNLPGSASDFDYLTLGVGYDGKGGVFDWTSEVAVQFGDVGDRNVSAYMLAFGGGYQYKEHPWKPRVGLTWDIASGDSDPNDDRVGTFHQQFPLGHAYFGWADQVGRRNINAFGVQLSAKPSKVVVAKLNWYSFNLVENKDALYNAGGKVSRQDITGASGKHVGNELDALVIIKLSRHASFHMGYLHFAPGSFIANTGTSETHNMLYMQMPITF